MRFSMILEMVDRATAPAKRVKAGVRGISQSVRSMGTRVRQTARDLRTFEGRMRLAGRAGTLTGVSLRKMADLVGRGFRRAGRGARRLVSDLGKVARRLKVVERAGFAAGRGLKKLGGMAITGLKVAGAAMIGAGGFALFDLFRTGGQFEQYQVMLEGIEGSAKAARSSMRWVQEFTQSTPFELDDVMGAFISLKAYGIEPAEGSLEALGDAAAGMSKPLMQAVEMMADATTGEFERLKEFGIRARKEGDRVTFTYRKNGKEIQKSVAGTGSAIEEALIGIFSDRFGGGMARQAKTMFGLISNLKDLWTSFLVMVADAGIFDMVKSDLEGLLANVKKMADDGSLKRWAEQVSDRLEQAWSWGKELVEKTDWAAVAEDLRKMADAAKVVADAILTIAENWRTLSNVSRSLNPLQGGLLGEAYRQLTGANDNDSAGTSVGSASRAPARLPSASNPLRQFAPKERVEVGGKIEAQIFPPPGWTIRARSVSSRNKNVPTEVRTGRMMRGAA